VAVLEELVVAAQGVHVAAKRARVLVVDDHDDWRNFVCSLLKRQTGLRVVGEAADGSEAIQKIKDLQPDLIVLDLGLPGLNGLEVALQIRELSPRSKVLMVTQMRAADVAEEAFRRGVLGYVVKSEAADELLPAIEAVLQGKQFVSQHLVGSVLKDSRKGEAAPPEGHDENVITESGSPKLDTKARHEVEFYPDDATFVAGLTRCVESGLRRGDTVFVLATESHRAGILQNLQAQGLDSGALMDRGRLVLPDPYEALAEVMVDGKPDAERCDQLLGALIDTAPGNSAEAKHVSFCGQIAPLLLRQGDAEGAIELEHIWDQISLAHGANIFCGYISSGIPDTNRGEIVPRICAAHSHVYGLESSI
jgi:DNA-binding NarL/FixJ family response regulator